jgi:gliding motility-associated lipoprotein GldD
MRTINLGLSVFFVLMILLVGCNSSPDTGPKPRMYPKQAFPDRVVNMFKFKDCPIAFDKPDYLVPVKDSAVFDSKVNTDCWFDLGNKDLQATIHFSYFKVKNRKNFDQLVNDVYKMADEHNTKASFRKESVIDNGSNVHGLMFEIEGAVASPLQFYLTDSTNHFLRASLYFDTRVNPDSTKIIYDFIYTDISRIINTFNWKN